MAEHGHPGVQVGGRYGTGGFGTGRTAERGPSEGDRSARRVFGKDARVLCTQVLCSYVPEVLGITRQWKMA